MGVRFSLTMDASDPVALARFWAAALGDRQLGGPDPGEDGTGEWATLDDPSGQGPNVFFQRVPEGKVAKNRQHFDLRVVGSIPDEVRRLTALGGRVLREDGDPIWMADPEGNEFCVE